MPGGTLVIVPFTEPVLLPVVVIGPAFVVPGGTLIMLPGSNVPVLLVPIAIIWADIVVFHTISFLS
jgi:hypothetical protein